MATMKFVVFAAACLCAHAFPQEPTGPATKNTIFTDEKLEGGIFENLDSIEEFQLSRNNDNSSLYRLPTTTRPRHYNVLWVINIAELVMSGSVEIQLYATQADVNEIVIHADDMDIISLTLTQGNTVVPIRPYIMEEETQFLIIPLQNGFLAYNPASPVIYNLSISFSAALRNDMYGIYRSWFRNNPTDTNVSWMATTQFQATAARWAFPCYDEPSFKATFDITIRRPSAFKSWSCTRIQETRPSTFTGYEDDVYTRTPVMSTYLLALIVAEYDTKPETLNGQLIYEVIARPGAMNANQGDYAFEVGMELLDKMNEHTALNYYSVNSNLTMTQASIPDFGAGAMENWGLLTYREAYIMYDPEHTDSSFKQRIAYILSHEIAHMWFGNLVTCDWWDVLWLNEGFARYYQYYLTHWVEDYMGLDTRFINEQIHTSLLSDSANNPHPLSTSKIGNPASVSGMFSTITYNKGAAIIRMTEHLLGFNVHEEGLRNYLSQKSFETALPIDLFNALQNVSNVYGALAEYGSDFSVIDYYKSWTDQAGHPVLSVQVNHTTGDMTIYQRRFNINTGYSITNNNNYIVPVTFATAANPDFNNTKPTHIIRKAITVINRGSVGQQWVVFNKQQTGFYRVNYDDYTWNLITLALRGNDRTLIHEYNRAQIVNDVFQFARSGLMNYTRAFTILSFLEFETEYTPWIAAVTGFNWMRNRLAGTPQLIQLESLIARWANVVINQIGYYPIANETFMQSYLRAQLVPLLCLVDAPGCRDAAIAQFRGLVDDGVEVPVDSRIWVYCNGLRNGNQSDFTTMWNRFLNHNTYTEKILLLQVLGCTPHQASLNTFLNAIATNNYIIRPQDYTTALNSAVTGNEGNTQIVFQYIQNNLQLVTEAFGSPITPLSYVSSRLRTEAEITAFQLWANQTQALLGNSYQAVYNSAESSRQSIQWADEVQSDLLNYFQNGNQPLEVTTAAPTTQAPVVTVTPPTLVQPVTPDLPTGPTDSAVTSFVSMLIIVLAVIVHIIV